MRVRDDELKRHRRGEILRAAVEVFAERGYFAARMREVAQRVGEMASEYGRANGFDAIFLYNAQPLAFIADGANVTDIVISMYNERYPVQ